MFSTKRLLSVIALFSVLVSPAFADEIFSIKAGYLSLNPSGDVAVSVDSLDGTVADLDDDLGVDDSDDYFVEAALQLGSFRLFAAYLPLDFSGDSVLPRDIDFNGETFAQGSRVESDVDIDIYEAGLAWYLVNLDDLPVRIQFGPEVAVKYVDASVKMQDKDYSLDESESLGVPVPTLGARARVAIADYLGVVGRVGYMQYDGNDFLDVDAQVEFSPIPLVGLFGGYRYLDIDVDDNDVLIDATFAGPYVGALVRF
jgi:outer membrane protein